MNEYEYTYEINGFTSSTTVPGVNRIMADEMVLEVIPEGAVITGCRLVYDASTDTSLERTM